MSMRRSRHATRAFCGSVVVVIVCGSRTSRNDSHSWLFWRLAAERRQGFLNGLRSTGSSQWAPCAINWNHQEVIDRSLSCLLLLTYSIVDVDILYISIANEYLTIENGMCLPATFGLVSDMQSFHCSLTEHMHPLSSTPFFIPFDIRFVSFCCKIAKARHGYPNGTFLPLPDPMLPRVA